MVPTKGKSAHLHRATESSHTLRLHAMTQTTKPRTLHCAQSCSKYSWEPWIHRRCPRRAGPGVGPSTCNCIARRCATSKGIAGGAAGLIAPSRTRIKSSVRDPPCKRPPFARGGGKGGATTGSPVTTRTVRKISAWLASTRRISATGTQRATAERAVCVDMPMEKTSSEPRAVWRAHPWSRCRPKSTWTLFCKGCNRGKSLRAAAHAPHAVSTFS